MLMHECLYYFLRLSASCRGCVLDTFFYVGHVFRSYLPFFLLANVMGVT